MRWLVSCAFVVVGAMPAAAQSTYIGATIVADITRFSRAEREGQPSVSVDPSSMDGEALGFNVSVGRSIGERWGVALEVGRSGEIERRSTQRIAPMVADFVVTPSPLPTLLPPIPELDFELTSEQQYTAISALAWVKHDAGSRIELSYSAGITFLRSELERAITISDPRLAIWLPVAQNVKTIEHTAGPTVSVEAAIRFTDHTAFTAGAHLHAIGVAGQNGWLFRPALGVRWTF